MGSPMQGVWASRLCRHNFVILRQNDLKLGIHVLCCEAKCSAQKCDKFVLKHHKMVEIAEELCGEIKGQGHTMFIY